MDYNNRHYKGEIDDDCDDEQHTIAIAQQHGLSVNQQGGIYKTGRGYDFVKKLQVAAAYKTAKEANGGKRPSISELHRKCLVSRKFIRRIERELSKYGRILELGEARGVRKDLSAGKDTSRVLGLNFIAETAAKTTTTTTKNAPTDDTVQKASASANSKNAVAGKRKRGRPRKTDAQVVPQQRKKRAKPSPTPVVHSAQQPQQQQQQQKQPNQPPAAPAVPVIAAPIMPVPQPCHHRPITWQAANHALRMEQEKEIKDKEDKLAFAKWYTKWGTWEDELNAHYKERYSDGWDKRFQELKRFKQKNNGECNDIPRRYRDPEDMTLDEWAEHQRKLYWEGKLDSERVESLTEQGFQFDFEYPEIPSSGDAQFDEKVSELIEYKKVHSNCDVPIDYKESLGQWVERQRKLYNEGTLAKDKQVILDSRGFIFEPGKKVRFTMVSDAWRKSYKELVQFKRDNGHLEVPTGFKASSASVDLCKWVGRQRYKYKKLELSINHIRLLEEVGLDLNEVKKSAGHVTTKKWDAMFNLLVAYKNEHGDIPVKGKPLGPWLKVQQKFYNSGRLLESRKQRLLSVGVVFDSSDQYEEEDTAKESIFDSPEWAGNYEALRMYYEENGHVDVPETYYDDHTKGLLHLWIETQKRFYQDGILPPPHADLLSELGIDLNEIKTYTGNKMTMAWDKSYEALKKFKEENGHINVPSDYINEAADVYGGNTNLGSWLSNQRDRFKSGRLLKDRMLKLEELGVEFEKIPQYRIIDSDNANATSLPSSSGPTIETDAKFKSFPILWNAVHDHCTANGMAKSSVGHQTKSSLDEDKAIDVFGTNIFSPSKGIKLRIPGRGAWLCKCKPYNENGKREKCPFFVKYSYYTHEACYRILQACLDHNHTATARQPAIEEQG